MKAVQTLIFLFQIQTPYVSIFLAPLIVLFLPIDEEPQIP